MHHVAKAVPIQFLDWDLPGYKSFPFFQPQLSTLVTNTTT